MCCVDCSGSRNISSPWPCCDIVNPNLFSQKLIGSSTAEICWDKLNDLHKYQEYLRPFSRPNFKSHMCGIINDKKNFDEAPRLFWKTISVSKNDALASSINWKTIRNITVVWICKPATPVLLDRWVFIALEFV